MTHPVGRHRPLVDPKLLVEHLAIKVEGRDKCFENGKITRLSFFVEYPQRSVYIENNFDISDDDDERGDDDDDHDDGDDDDDDDDADDDDDDDDNNETPL